MRIRKRYLTELLFAGICLAVLGAVSSSAGRPQLFIAGALLIVFYSFREMRRAWHSHIEITNDHFEIIEGGSNGWMWKVPRADITYCGINGNIMTLQTSRLDCSISLSGYPLSAARRVIKALEKPIR